MTAAKSSITGEGASKISGRSGQKVVVASKLPMALELQLCVKRTQRFKNQASVWEEDVWAKDGPIVTIAGTAYPQGTPPDGMPDKPMMAAGAALTFGVDKDFFDAWLEQNKNEPMVRNGMIFAHARIDGVKGMAKELKDKTSGLGPLTPDNDRRMPKKMVKAPRAPNRDGDTSDDAIAAMEAAE